jgi:hypothetical protein
MTYFRVVTISLSGDTELRPDKAFGQDGRGPDFDLGLQWMDPSVGKVTKISLHHNR